MKPTITLSRIIALFSFILISSVLHSQEAGTIVGTIKSEFGEKLQAVNIVIRDVNKGATTDEDGRFVINDVPAGTYVLDISSIGFEQLEERVVVRVGKVTRLALSMNNTITSLSEIYVKGEAFRPENRTITVDVVDLQDIRTLNIEQPLRLIEQVPGVDLIAYRQGGVADQFSIRGFSGGGHAGQAGVQIDGMSLNEAEGHSDGYADLNVLIPLNIKRMKVYKGPSSVLFGQFAQGGTLALESRKGGNYQDVSITGGSFNTFDAQFAMGKELPLNNTDKKLRTNLALQFFQTDGYSENAHTLRGNLSGRVAYDITDKTDISLSLLGHSSQWDAPGYISEAQFNDEDRRNQQDANAEKDGGEKQFYSQRIDVNHNFNDNLRLLLFGYSVQQKFTRFAKFGFQPGGQSERFNTRQVYATGGSLNGSNRIGNTDVNWIAGLEFYSEETERMRWNTSDRVRQEQTQDRVFTIQSISAFLQGEFDVNRFFRPTIGLRYDTYYGDFNANDPNQDPIRDSFNGLSNISPKIGVRSTIYDGLDLRANVSNGFSLPNSALKYDANIDLSPVQLWQYEVGANYQAFRWLELDVVGFVLNSSNEIFENPPGSAEFMNAGETRRTGIESKATLSPLPGLRIQGTFSYIETEVIDNPEQTLEGNALTGVPQTIGTFDISYTTNLGLGGRFRFRDVGSYFISPDNMASYEGYTVSHLAVFYNFGRQSANLGRVFFEINNLFDAKYAESVFGSVDSRSFAPAPTRNFSLGVSYNF
ncbi:MAG: TonB-dependent receptor [Saprospiraceae bacterium]|nr:TonB-dependent receptor [Saprospiraceae bacterium]